MLADYVAPKKIKIVYFTGTGGTRLAAEQLAKAMSRKGITVFLGELNEREQNEVNEKEDLLILLFPVYAFNAPQPVYDYIRKREPVAEIPAAVISVSGGGEVTPNKASRLHTIRCLEKRGFQVVYERMIVMPSNAMDETPRSVAIRLIQILPEKIQKIADDLSSNVTRCTKLGFIDKCLAMLGEGEKIGARWFGRHITVDDCCSGCELCARSCPTDNIAMDNNKPVFGHKCATCMRCLYNCPQNALQPRLGKFLVLKNGFRLSEFEQGVPTVNTDNPEQPYGVLWKGIQKYFEEND